MDKETKEPMDDKLMFLYLVENPSGELIGNKEGKFKWVNQDEWENYITQPFETKEQFEKELKMIDKFSGQIGLWEEVHYNSELF